MDRLIDAVALEKKSRPGVRGDFGYSAKAENWNVSVKDIREAPTIDAMPVRHGHWIHKFGYNGERHTICSSCGHDRCGHFSFSFCMDCGAKMDEEVE